MPVPKLHPLTAIAWLIATACTVLLSAGHAHAALVGLTVAYALALVEFKTHTSVHQIVLLFVLGAALGLALEHTTGAGPWFVLSILAAVSATTFRQALIVRISAIGLPWVDSALAVLAVALYSIGVDAAEPSWPVWLPVVPLLGAVGLVAFYLHDGVLLRRKARFGYQVQVGMSAPDFELKDQDGTPVRLSQFRDRHPVLLVFVRGDWCPGCHMLLRTYEQHRMRFLERQVHVLGIGPDDIRVNKAMVERLGVSYHMLSDDGQRIAGRYGIIYNNPSIEIGLDYAQGIPLPAAFLVDMDGQVRYVSRPDRPGEFLDPHTIFSALGELPLMPALA